MKKFVMVLLFLLIIVPSLHAQKYRAGQPPPTPYPNIDFPLPVHISAIRMRTECDGANNCSNLIYVDATLSGKKLELAGNQYYHTDREQARFAIGDYKARALKDKTPKDGPYLGQKYQIVVADGTFWPCAVTGLLE